jgi:ankyrin repeat protein
LRFGANPRKKNDRGESALALACMQENAEICEKLIYAKADVNEMDNQRRTPLLKAARHNSKADIIQLLMKAGAKVDTCDNDYNTPLHFASQRGTLEVGYFLLKLGADPYARNKKGFVAYELNAREEVREMFGVCMVCSQTPTTLTCNHCHVIRYCHVEC